LNVTEFSYLTQSGHANHVTLRTEEVPDLDNLMQGVCGIMAKAPKKWDDRIAVDVQNWRAELRAVPNQDKPGLHWHAEVWRTPDTQGAALDFFTLVDAQNLRMVLQNL